MAKNKPDNEEPYFWVQCEYPQCMKWRKIILENKKDVENGSWYCHMNPDKAYSFCEAPQEKMHVKRGETVVFSELDLGALVMAKMTGYPRYVFHKKSFSVMRFTSKKFLL